MVKRLRKTSAADGDNNWSLKTDMELFSENSGFILASRLQSREPGHHHTYMLYCIYMYDIIEYIRKCTIYIAMTTMITWTVLLQTVGGRRALIMLCNSKVNQNIKQYTVVTTTTIQCNVHTICRAPIFAHLKLSEHFGTRCNFQITWLRRCSRAPDGVQQYMWVTGYGYAIPIR